ncbi:hypothetical protein BDV96DRAFT_678516, partial [Lophiotrema nucula]
SSYPNSRNLGNVKAWYRPDRQQLLFVDGLQFFKRLGWLILSSFLHVSINLESWYRVMPPVFHATVYSYIEGCRRRFRGRDFRLTIFGMAVIYDKRGSLRSERSHCSIRQSTNIFPARLTLQLLCTPETDPRWPTISTSSTTPRPTQHGERGFQTSRSGEDYTDVVDRSHPSIDMPNTASHLIHYGPATSTPTPASLSPATRGT